MLIYETLEFIGPDLWPPWMTYQAAQL